MRWSVGCRHSGPHSPRYWVSRTRSPFWHDASAPPRKSSRPQPGGPWGTRPGQRPRSAVCGATCCGWPGARWPCSASRPLGGGPPPHPRQGPALPPHLSVHHLHSSAITHSQHSRVGGEVCPTPGRGVPEHKGLGVLVDLLQPWGDRPAMVGRQASHGGETGQPWWGDRLMGGDWGDLAWGPGHGPGSAGATGWGGGFLWGRGVTRPEESTDRWLRNGCRWPALQAGEGYRAHT